MPLYVVDDVVVCGGYIHTYIWTCVPICDNIAHLLQLLQDGRLVQLFYCVFPNLQRGRTALHHATAQGSKEYCKLLVHEFTADPEEVESVSQETVTAPKGFICIDFIT